MSYSSGCILTQANQCNIDCRYISPGHIEPSTILHDHCNCRVTKQTTLFIYTSPFSVTNGVWHGGVLSPILFTVYIDELLQRLQKLGVGCHWEGMFVGGLCYADDLALIAPSAHALRRMLQVCSDLVLWTGVNFHRYCCSPRSHFVM